MGRIFLFGSAVVSVLLLTLIYAIVSGQYAARQPVASPTPGSAEPTTSAVASVSGAAGASASAVPTASASLEPSGSGGATAVMVPISKLSFGSNLTIAAGATVTFMNNDAVKHTATNGTNGTPASGSLFDLQLDPGASGSYTFTEAGTYQVTCTLHPTMKLTITVT
jgi:Plastocyanin